MSEYFSFIGNPAQVILKNSKLLVPGIERVDVIFFDPLRKQVCAEMSTKQGEDYHIEHLSVGSNSKNLNRMRQRKTPAEWYHRNEIPYQFNREEANKKGVFGEIDKVVLLNRFPNNFDGANDLVFFYFESDMSNFLVSGNKNRLTTEMKNVIARNIRNSLLMILSNASNDQKVLKMISENMAAVSQNLENMNLKLNKIQKKYQESLVISCKHYLDKFSAQNKRLYSFSESATQRIKEYDGEFHRLEDIISRAVEIANNLVFGHPVSEITLTESHLNFSLDEKPAGDLDPLEHGIYAVSAKFLNRLEIAAKRAQQQNMQLTSKNVANSLDNPVKPPAISYSVDYHKENIKKLFKLYPDRWQLLKSDFKPIMKLVDRHYPSASSEHKTG